MKKRIAVPVDNNDILDAHFGHCPFFILMDIENEKIISNEKITPPPHEPGLLPKWLSERGISDIIAGGMGQRAIQLFNEQGVDVFVGAPKLSAKELVEGYLEKTLNFTANYCDH